jgi:NAD(P)H-hydrate epimerase
LTHGAFDTPRGDEAVAVDGLLGTGATGEARDAIADALVALKALRAQGSFILALDTPSGLNATTGQAATATVAADVTVTFGTLKRGLITSRGVPGAIEVADIGLGAAANINDGAPVLLDARDVTGRVPLIGASSHKGTRGQVTIVGGNAGMAGATVFAARGALRSGAGLVRVVVAPASVSAVQEAVPEATAATWPATAADVAAALGAPDALVIGPGLGVGNIELLRLVFAAASTPLVLDADALNAFAGDTATLHRAIAGHRAVLTPHPAECARLLGTTTASVLANRFDIGLTLARATNAVVVLKGTPSIVSAPDGRVVVAPVGSPVLATGGSGDLLAGIAGALMAEMDDAFDAALAAVWAHGAAAEHVATTNVRGATLGDVVTALRDVWHLQQTALPAGVLAMLPAVGER